jgi:hypothetical protein
MPRLVGKQSNNEFLAGFVLAVAIGAAAVGAEYYGYTNLVPDWGRDRSDTASSIKLLAALNSPLTNSL